MGTRLSGDLDFTFSDSPEKTLDNRFFLFIQAVAVGCNLQTVANTGAEGLTLGCGNEDFRNYAGEKVKVNHCSWGVAFSTLLSSQFCLKGEAIALMGKE